VNGRRRSILPTLVVALSLGVTACGGVASTPTPPLASVAPSAAPSVAPSAAPSAAARVSPSASTVATVATATRATVAAPTVPANATASRAVAPATPATRTPGTPVAGPGGTITATYTLADLPLAAVQNAVLPGSVTNDRGLLLGGIGSDLWHGPNDAPNEFWMVTDRGPNGQIRVSEANRRTFPIPEFDPLIVRVRVEGTAITILETLPIRGQSGKAVTGLSNPERDEPPYDYSAQTRLPLNPNGLDTEGLVRAPDGSFWLVDEHSPSLLKLDARGTVIKRWIPEGIALPGADYPVSATLPAIYSKRKGNRGFEGLGLSPDGKTLAIVLQSPLLNPDAATGNASRNTRVLLFDAITERVTAEYAYRLEDAATFDPKAPKADEMKLSAVVVLGPTTLLIEERTDNVARLYLCNLAGATNLLGTKWDDAATTPTLEASGNLPAVGVTPLAKTLAVDLAAIPGIPGKIEGIAVLDRNTIAIANDNDFDIGDFGPDGNNKGTGAKSRILIIRLAQPLP